MLQGEIFAAEGYAKVTGEVGVCIATSGPGATNLVTGLADALLDSVPMVAITGQVCTFFSLTRNVSKHAQKDLLFLKTKQLLFVSPNTGIFKQSLL